MEGRPASLNPERLRTGSTATGRLKRGLGSLALRQWCPPPPPAQQEMGDLPSPGTAKDPAGRRAGQGSWKQED